MFTSNPDRRGAATVEFAIVAPVLVLLLLGLLEVGRMITVTAMVANASREGARAAVLDNADTTKVRQIVNAYLTSCAVYGRNPDGSPKRVTDASVTITPAGWENSKVGDPIYVEVSLDKAKVSWVKNRFITSNPSYTTAMRKLGVQ